MPTLADWHQVYDDLDWDGLFENHPLNEGRVFWGLGLPPLDGGPQLYDLTQNTSGGALAGSAGWTPSYDGVNGLNLNGTSAYLDCGLVNPGARPGPCKASSQ